MRAAYPGVSGGRDRTRRATNLGPFTPSQRRVLAGARQFGELMDSRFSILGFRFGLDSLIGLGPGVGDAISATASVYLLWAAVQLKVPPTKLTRMVMNTLADLGFGLVPVVGDLADAVFKSHMHNLRIIEEHARRVESVVDGRVVRR